MALLSGTKLAKAVRPPDLDLAKTDWLKLISKEERCGPFSSQERTGLHVLDEFFFSHRLRAAGKSGWTFPEAYANNKTRKYLEGKLKKLRRKTLRSGNKDYETQLYHIFQLYYGAVNQFRPTEAMRLLCLLRPTEGVLDFSSGWGGRCLASMAYGIPYYGCDANTELGTPYSSMVKFCQENLPESKTGLTGLVEMTFKPSETVQDFRSEIAHGQPYDLIFTSPPYFTLEKYRGMPTYAGREGFLRDFLGVCIKRAWLGLSHGGHMAINMPVFMYEWVKEHWEELGLPQSAAMRKIKLSVKSRHGKNAARGLTLGTTASERRRFEWIYVWKKD